MSNRRAIALAIGAVIAAATPEGAQLENGNRTVLLEQMYTYGERLSCERQCWRRALTLP
jgi:hypothetical protein